MMQMFLFFWGCCIHYDLQICESTGLRGWVFEEGKVLWMGLVKFDQSYHLRLNPYVYICACIYAYYNFTYCTVSTHVDTYCIYTFMYIYIFKYTHLYNYIYTYNVYTQLCIMYITFNSSSYVYILFAQLFEDFLPNKPNCTHTFFTIQMPKIINLEVDPGEHLEVP